MTAGAREKDRNEKNEGLGLRLREAREYLGLSQEAVADFVGIGRASVSAIESGKRRVTAVELNDFSRLFGVAPSELLGEGPPAGSGNATMNALFRTTRSLAPDDQDQVLKFAKFLQSVGRPENKSLDPGR